MAYLVEMISRSPCQRVSLAGRMAGTAAPITVSGVIWCEMVLRAHTLCEPNRLGVSHVAVSCWLARQHDDLGPLTSEAQDRTHPLEPTLV